MKNKKIQIINSTAEFLVFTMQENNKTLEVFVRNETLWMSARIMGELFDTSVDNILLHLKNIYAEEELSKEATTEESSVVQNEGGRKVNRKINLYNLDAIISVGYRINSHKATQFRQWATNILKSFAVKGYVLDYKRLENGTFFDRDYFEDLLQEIREIRTSERRFYQKITDIYSTSVDYNPDDKLTKQFFATVQNKLHFAIHGKTASELIVSRADNLKPYMGLRTWKHSPKGKILPSDTVIAKNYLTLEEIEGFERITAMYVDYAEDQAKRHIPMTMADWINKLNTFLQFNERKVLSDFGKVSQEFAKNHAITEFEKYRIIQDRLYQSDFDKTVGKIKQIKGKKK